MSFTATHYNEVARIIREEREYNANPAGNVSNGGTNTARRIQAELSRMFASDNPRFDAERFALNCEPKAGGAK